MSWHFLITEDFCTKNTSLTYFILFLLCFCACSVLLSKYAERVSSCHCTFILALHSSVEIVRGNSLPNDYAEGKKKSEESSLVFVVLLICEKWR